MLSRLLGGNGPWVCVVEPSRVLTSYFVDKRYFASSSSFSVIQYGTTGQALGRWDVESALCMARI